MRLANLDLAWINATTLRRIRVQINQINEAQQTWFIESVNNLSSSTHTCITHCPTNPSTCSINRYLTHRGRATHICVGKLTTIGSDNGLSPERRQAIIWTNAGILLIGPLGANFSEILNGIQTFSLRKMDLKISSAKWRSFCLGLNRLTPVVLNPS